VKVLAFVLSIILFTNFSWALEYGCQIDPKNLNEAATKAVVNYYRQKQSVPNALIVTSEFEAEWSGTEEEPEQKMYGTLEGFYRPQENDYYSILPVPILGMSLSRQENMIYICAHFNEDPAKTHFTAYLFRGNHLDPLRFGNFIGDFGSSPKLKIKPLPASIVGIGKVRRQLSRTFRWMPLFDLGLQATEQIQGLVVKALGDFSKVGVERITMTQEYIEIASGVDLGNPSKARLQKKINFHQK